MLTFGIILHAAAIDRWQLNCIERLRQSKLAELRYIVNVEGPAQNERTERLYNRVPIAERVDALELLALFPEAQYADPSARFDADFFLNFGSGDVTAPLLDIPRFGIWHFALSDITRFSSNAPGFWEIHGDHEVTGAFLLRLTGSSDAGVVLKRGFLPTIRHSFESNVEALLDMVTTWPAHVCWDITHGAASYFAGVPLAQPPEQFGTPSRTDVAAMRLRERRERASLFMRQKFSRIEWTIARVDGAPAQFIGADRRADVSYIYPSEKQRYFADPCVVVRDSRDYIFCEEYRTQANIGAVAVSEVTDGGVTAPRAVIEETHHLSYPHVFQYGGETYCIPESVGIGKVCLYRCTAFPDKWEYVCTLIDGFEAADSTIVHYGDRWWLFCTSREGGAKRYYSHLYIWHARDLFGRWTQHVRNPVKIDARSARPAGPLFVHEGRLYRPSQDCARSYGGALRINRIEKLTETEFEESDAGVIRPPAKGFSRGLHTLSAGSGYCIVDVERYRFSAVNARFACTQAVKRALLRIGVSEAAITWIERRGNSPGGTAIRTAQSSNIES